MDPTKFVNSKRRPLRQAIKECELRWFHETAALAQEGEAQQMALLAHMYTVGYGCKPNPEEASKWFDEASKLLGYNVRSDPAPIMSSVGPPDAQQQQQQQHRHHHHHHQHHHRHHNHSQDQQQQQQQAQVQFQQQQQLGSYGISPASSSRQAQLAAAAAAGGGGGSSQQLYAGGMPHPTGLSPAAAAAAAAAGASVTAG